MQTKMETTITSKHHSNSPAPGGSLLLVFLLLGGLALAGSVYFSSNPGVAPDNRVKMEKDSGKNGKHANQKARESAEREYQKVKEQINQIKNPPPGKPRQKSPEDKKLLQKLEDQLKHWKKKKDWTGETHSRKSKGD